MSMPSALRRLLVALTAAGSLVPGAGFEPSDSPAPQAAGPAAVVDTKVQRKAEAPLPVVDQASLRRTWSWPLTPRPAVVTPFVAPRSTYGAGHRGIDLGATQGQAVGAVDVGVVTHVGVIAGRGTMSVLGAAQHLRTCAGCRQHRLPGDEGAGHWFSRGSIALQWVVPASRCPRRFDLSRSAPAARRRASDPAASWGWALRPDAVRCQPTVGQGFWRQPSRPLLCCSMIGAGTPFFGQSTWP